MLRFGSLTRLLLATTVVVASPAILSSENPAPKAVKPNVSAEARIERALEQDAEFEFLDTPLNDVAKFIADRYEINVVVDRKALKAADTSVTIKLRNVSLRSALELMLRPLHLDWTIRSEHLLLTTVWEAESEYVVKIHDVTELVECGWTGDSPSQCIQIGDRKVLVFKATYREQYEFSELLRRLREIARKHASEGPVRKPARSPQRTISMEERIEQVLSRKAEFDFVEMPLCEVVDLVRRRYEINVVLDSRALGDVGVPIDTPRSFRLPNVSLRSALDLLLEELGLQWTVHCDALLITTRDAATTEEKEIVNAYDVTELMTSRDENGYSSGDDFDALAEMIQCTIEPATWRVGGGPGPIKGMRIGEARIIVGPQTYRVHRKVADLLDQIKRVARKHSADGRSSVRDRE